MGWRRFFEAETGDCARLWWSDTSDEATVDCGGLSTADAAEIVRAHAARHSGVESWVQAAGDFSGSDRGALSPRVGRPTDDVWPRWQRVRHGAINTISPEAVADSRFVGGLGEPAYWGIGRDPINPDFGASQWEMKTRNRGEDFVRNRLSLLAARVAQREPQAIAEGLTGERLVDEVGKGAADSRTPTGLRPPGPADNAMAWCALWGLSAFPVRPVAPTPANERPRSRTAGAWRGSRSTWVAVPVSSEPVTLARLRSVIRSAALRRVANSVLPAAERPTRSIQPEVEEARVAVDRAWLTQHRVAGVTVGRKVFTDNPNAPEPWIESVYFEALEAPTPVGEPRDARP